MKFQSQIKHILNIKAVVIALIAANVSSYLLTFLFAYVAASLANGHVVTESFTVTPQMRAGYFLILLTTSMFAGYIGGRISKRDEILHGVITGALYAAIILMFEANPVTQTIIVTYSTCLSLTVLGSFIARCERVFVSKHKIS